MTPEAFRILREFNKENQAGLGFVLGVVRLNSEYLKFGIVKANHRQTYTIGFCCDDKELEIYLGAIAEYEAER